MAWGGVKGPLCLNLHPRHPLSTVPGDHAQDLHILSALPLRHRSDPSPHHDTTAPTLSLRGRRARVDAPSTPSLPLIYIKAAAPLRLARLSSCAARSPTLSPHVPAAASPDSISTTTTTNKHSTLLFHFTPPTIHRNGRLRYRVVPRLLPLLR